MIRRLALAIAGAAFSAATIPTARAQAPLAVAIDLPPPAARSSQAPTVTLLHLFEDRRSRELLESGFVARMDVTVELWQSRTWFDDLVRLTTWRRLVQFDPVRNTYRVGRELRPDSIVTVEEHATLEELRAALSGAINVQIVAPRGLKGLYYRAIVTVETGNSDDLAEVQRWLRGDVQPTIRGKQNPASLVTRTLRWITSRAMGGDVKRAEKSSGRFDT